MYYLDKESAVVERCIKEAEYIIDNNATLRNASENLLIPKSTIHKDIHNNLRFYNVILYDQVITIMRSHWETRVYKMNKARGWKHATSSTSKRHR
jgi:hypothetical protein